jgi:diguanylate cyclase (GGDEF)-like protein
MATLYKNFNLMAETMMDFIEESSAVIWTDIVTNLPNRDRILIDIERTEKPSLILSNIDFFKEINDCYGNKIGDLILKETAYRLKKMQDELKYRLYRMPADEFALLFDCDICRDSLIDIVKLLSNVINERPFNINGHEINVRVSFGIAMCDDIREEEISEGKWRKLATNADMALKRAKRLQKNFIVYDESMEITKEYENNLMWKQKLKDAIHNQRIIPYFQPIVNNVNGKIEKYESLVRLIDKQGMVIHPHNFLDLAKKSHLYDNITKAMILRSFATFEKLDYEFSINLTVNDILDEDINKFIMAELKKNKNLSGRVVFEILESEGIENYKEVMVFIEQVKELGCKIAIDDFGSGYSNFEHIMRLEVDYIKIDSSLIKNLPYDKNSQIITKTIVNFARELKLKTISEFVHSREVYEKTVELGIDFSQGYYFGEPKEFLV